MIKLLITGVAGKMGNAILNLAMEDREIEIAGATEIAGHPLIGKHLFSPVGNASPATVHNDISEIITGCDVVIDFTLPVPSLQHFRVANSVGKAMVIGTTGFSNEAIEEIKDTVKIPIVLSPNMSVGMNLMFDLAERIAKTLKDEYDVEIVEMHHKWKKDAPSGTALKLKDVIENALPEKTWIEVFGRKGTTGERKKEEIGIMTLRGGDVVGEHTAIFAGIGERLEITHRAQSRDNFARGAIVAAKWIVNHPAGIYSMKDVLGLV
jgi:4-hydroxy-tetrahydrodipicolinate reductase